jgi:hypothetical protein
MATTNTNRSMIPEVKTIYNDHGVHITHDAWGNTYDISSPKHNITLWGDRITTYILDTNPLNKSDTKRLLLYTMSRSNIGIDSFCQVDSNGNPTYCDEAMVNNMVDRLAKLKAFV